MEPHCALKKEQNLLVYLHNKIHQSNLNSFLLTIIEILWNRNYSILTYNGLNTKS
jgi:hypothetical protein